MSLFNLLGKSAFGMESTQEKLGRLLNEAQALAEQLRTNNSLETDPVLRNQLVENSKRLATTLQTPIDRAWEVFFQPHHLSALYVAMDAGWLQLLNDAKTTGLSAEQLASSTTPHADPSLVKRLMRILTATGTIAEIGFETYAATEFSDLFCTPEWAAGLRHGSRDFAVSIAKMPEYFAENGLQAPPSAANGLYQYSHGIPFLQYLGQNAEAAKQFNVFMTAVRAGKKSWTETFPISEKLHVDSADDVLLVDIGGGKGHDLVEFSTAQKRMGLKGKLILQDLPRVTTQVPTEWNHLFEIQEHDFFRQQPVLHARAYFFKNVLHGWTDEECVSILSQTKDAMKPGYSKLLINEIVLPDVGCGFWGAGFDLSMLAVPNGRLRTGRQWEDLISKVDGLKLVKVWTVGSDGESVVEVDRKEKA